MASPINKLTLHHLAKLARIELKEHEEEKLLRDLQKILDHFEELESVDTSNVPPMSGGTAFKNVFREDGERENTNKKKGRDAFPDAHKGFLKVPPIK